MVVIVQLFAADEDAPRDEVVAVVFDVEATVADVVAEAVDDAGGPEGDPEHLHAPGQETRQPAEGEEVEGEQQGDT